MATGVVIDYLIFHSSCRSLTPTELMKSVLSAIYKCIFKQIGFSPSVLGVVIVKVNHPRGPCIITKVIFFFFFFFFFASICCLVLADSESVWVVWFSSVSSDLKHARQLGERVRPEVKFSIKDKLRMLVGLFSSLSFRRRREKCIEVVVVRR